MFRYQGTDYVITGPVEINLIVDAAEIHTEALVMEATTFPEPKVVGKHDICATGLSSQRAADGAIGLDEDSTILASFVCKKGHQMLKRLVDTGAGPAIWGKSAWNKLGFSDVELP